MHMVIVTFDLAVYIMLIPLRRDTLPYRIARALGCALILGFFVLGTYVLRWPLALATAGCMSVPSFLLFLALSRYRDSRFVLAFCLVDTITLIIAFWGWYVTSMLPDLAWLSFLTVLALCLSAALPWRKTFRKFRHLLETADAGWRTMAIATVFIYFAMIFFLAYPEPLVERMEYAPVWLVFAVVVLLCYAVFIQSVMKTQRIQDQNRQLKREQKFYHMAYTDSLTSLGNRAAWMEKLSDLERNPPSETLCCIMLDCDRFKLVNDSFGHHVGDEALRRVAKALKQIFPKGMLYRVGGDEFTALLIGVNEEQVRGQLAGLADELAKQGDQLGISLSVTAGFAFPDPDEGIKAAYIRADRLMYEHKERRPV